MITTTLARYAALLLLVGSVAAQIPEVGKPAPAFAARADDGKSVSFPPTGQWSVLAFYPKAATPG